MTTEELIATLRHEANAIDRNKTGQVTHLWLEPEAVRRIADRLEQLYQACAAFTPQHQNACNHMGNESLNPYLRSAADLIRDARAAGAL